MHYDILTSDLIQRAAQLARSLGHSYVGSAHLLLVMAREPGAAGQTLRLLGMDPDLTEAALDLGCTPVQAFFKVVLHEIMPGILSGALMAFTMSLDDFVISYFVTGSGFVTLPVEIYSYTKKPIQPKVYAMFTLIFIAILLLMVVMNLMQARDKTKRKKAHGLQKEVGR